MLTAAVTSWRGLFAQRFFLGFVESVLPTPFMCIVSGYYTQQEQALRQSWWFSSTGGWTIIGGALNYGFVQITGGSLVRWQYIYLLIGSLTIIFGVGSFAVPNSAVTAWFLSPEERVVAVERLRKRPDRCEMSDAQGVPDSRGSIRYQNLAGGFHDGWRVSQTLCLSKTCTDQYRYTVNGAVSGFGPLIVSTFG